MVVNLAVSTDTSLSANTGSAPVSLSRILVAIIDPIGPVTNSMVWSDKAVPHIARITGFVHRMVRRRAEDYVRSEGRLEVTSDDLSLLAKRRFGDAGPPKMIQMLRSGGNK